jgi:hypothetical protein
MVPGPLHTHCVAVAKPMSGKVEYRSGYDKELHQRLVDALMETIFQSQLVDGVPTIHMKETLYALADTIAGVLARDPRCENSDYLTENVERFATRVFACVQTIVEINKEKKP